VALSLLVTMGEMGDPASTLVRSLVECASRGHWILDHDIDHRGWCARAVMFELVSLYHPRHAATNLPAGAELTTTRADARTARPTGY
jgi:hypothetical protein